MVDLIDMTVYKNKNKNVKHDYIFSCVDYFSGKAFAVSIKDRNNEKNGVNTLTNAIKKICEEADTIPHIIQCDSEFNQGDFKKWCDSKNIKLQPTMAHTPQS